MTRAESNISKLIGTRIKKTDPAAEVFLFGSRARGHAADDSDWDILILIDKPKKDRSIEQMYRDQLFELELELGESISTLIYSKNDWESRHLHSSLYLNIKEEGIRIA
jgi:predicted nucleotidyltransferase